MIKIAIAEDNQKLMELLKQKIQLNENYQVNLTAINGKDLLQNLIHNHNFDIVFMDINMPLMNGIEATNKIANKYPQIKIIISSVYDDEDNIFEAIKAGATGYILKDANINEVHKAIEETMSGGAPMSTEIARKALNLIRTGKPQKNDLKDFGLTAREIEILNHLSKGLQYDEIADNLNISNGTVRKHIENIYKKLQVNNKVEAIQKVNF